MAGLQRSASVKFYYDIVCPFAYMASTLVEKLAERTGSEVIWTPVLLGGLYEATNATQGKAGSATDVMSLSKLKISGQDLHRQLVRRGVPYRAPHHHPQKTVNAMRMLSAISDHSTRVSVSHRLYQAYWYGQKDLTDMDILQDAVSPFGMTATEILKLDSASQNLRANTAEAAERGAFGVPGFYIGEKLYWGTDRMFLVERALGMDSHPERLTSNPSFKGSAKLSFFFDYSSPWSYLAMERLSEVVSSVQPIQVKIEFIPILLGALFKEIGTAMVPGAAMNEAKRNYFRQDLFDWSDYAGVKLTWPDTFPLRTVLPLRVTLAADCDPNLIQHLFRAAWQENKNIGDPKILESVLKEVSSVTTEDVLSQGQSPAVKAQLFSNTKRAVEEGLCGVPSFQVNGGEIVWGQDKLNVIADQLCGWKTPFQDAAKL